MDFRTRLEQVFEQFEFIWFSVKRRYRRCERFRQFRDSAKIVIEIGWIGVRRQLLKGQQNPYCLNWCKGILTAKLRLTCKARLLLLSWRSSRGAVGSFFLSCCHHVRVVTNLFWTSCHHVRVNFGHHMWVGFFLWAFEWARVMRKIPHFGIGIIWGAILMSFPVFWISVSGRSLNSYGTSPNLWVQKELVKFWQGIQDTWLRFAKFFREFLGYPPLNLLGDLGDVILG